MKPYYEQDGITIYHGDCRDILPRLDTGSIDLVLTDPPYGIDYATNRKVGGVGGASWINTELRDCRQATPTGRVAIGGGTPMTRTDLSAEAVWGVLERLPGWCKRPKGMGAQTFGCANSYVNLYDTGRIIAAIDPSEVTALQALGTLLAERTEGAE